MKILFLDAYFNPESTPFTYLENDIIEAFVKDGHTVDVICPIPTRGVSKEVAEKYKGLKFENLYNGQVNVRRFLASKEGKNPIIRAFRYLWCNVREYMIGKKYKDIDLIFCASTPPTQGMLAGKLAKKIKCSFVYSLQDIFPDSLVYTKMTKKGSLIWKIGSAVEKKTYEYADKIVVISEDFKKNLLSKNVPTDKISVIRNWADTKSVKAVERENNSLFDTYGIDRSKFYVCYSGNIGHTQNMDMLLEVAEELLGMPEIGFILVGDGAARVYVEERVKKENINNIIMLPFQEYEKISEVFSLGDCGLIISKSGVGNNSVPSKTWSIMSAERPVIASFDKGFELDRVITEADCGICVQADDKDALKKAIFEMYENRDFIGEKGKNGRKYIMDNLTREIGTSKWVEVIKNI
jgi:glycosyltransferase involved in cell wall biosynthesis